MTEERFLLKDLFNPETIGVVANAVASESSGFDTQGFLNAVFDEEWEGLELKQRMRHVTGCLRNALPDNYERALEILVRASPRTDDAGFAAMVMSDFVEAYGIDHFEPSVSALAEFTRIVFGHDPRRRHANNDSSAAVCEQTDTTIER